MLKKAEIQMFMYFCLLQHETILIHVEEGRNTNVYVSGLPPDITVDEFIQLMSKFGIIMRDPQTEEFSLQ